MADGVRRQRCARGLGLEKRVRPWRISQGHVSVSGTAVWKDSAWTGIGTALQTWRRARQRGRRRRRRHKQQTLLGMMVTYDNVSVLSKQQSLLRTEPMGNGNTLVFFCHPVLQTCTNIGMSNPNCGSCAMCRTLPWNPYQKFSVTLSLLLSAATIIRFCLHHMPSSPSLDSCNIRLSRSTVYAAFEWKINQVVLVVALLLRPL